jgi:predicted amidohydrolase YtcJ
MTDPLLLLGAAWCPTGGDTDAVAVADGRIVATGPQARTWAAEARAETVELPEQTLLIPAFGDGHAHPLLGGLEAEGPHIRPQTSVAAIVAEVRRWAAEHPDQEWIRGASYDSSLSPEGLFDARWLDEAVSDRAVMLRAWDYHTAWVNTRALEVAGITAQTPDPPLGELPRRPDGSVLGTMREWGAVDLIDAAAGPVPTEVLVRSIERAGRAYAALGVTWVQDAWVTPEQLDAWIVAAETDRLPIRFNLALYADPRTWPNQLPQLVAARERVRALGNALLTAESVKFFADGVVENATASVIEPYCLAPHGHGMLVWAPQLLAEAVTAVDAEGFQPHIHTIGDRAARVALDAIEAATRANGPRDRRAVLAHVQLVDEADRPRFAELSVVANAEPLWAQLDALMNVLTVPRLGPQRSDRQYAFATMASLGAALSFGSDWPVSSADPLAGLATGCSRQTEDRDPPGGWTPHERLTVQSALAAYTRGVAHQGFRTAGELTPGADADLTLLSGDPRTLAEPRDLDRLTVLGTWLAGRLIHRQEQ